MGPLEERLRKRIREILSDMEIREDNLYPKAKPVNDETMRTNLMKVLNYSKQPKEEILKSKEKIRTTINDLTKELEDWAKGAFGDATI